MRKRVQSFISVLCALALLLGCAPLAMAESTDAVAVSVISVQWDDVNNQDGLRPAAVTAALYGGGAEYDKVTLTEENNWTGMLAAPAYAGEAPVSYQWKVDAPAGYSARVEAAKDGTTAATLTHKPATLDTGVKLTWQNDENAQALRPDSVNVQLLCDGLPCAVATLSAGNGWAAEWTGLPRNSGGGKAAAYTVAAPEAENYTIMVYGRAEGGFVVTAVLETGRLTVSRQVQNAPAETDLSKLTYEVSGPDSRLPVTVSDAEFVLENAAPGSYLVKETYRDDAAEGFTLDPAASVTTAAVRVKPGGTGAVTLNNVFVEKKEAEGEAKADNGPGAAELNQLTFIIDGPDERMPMTVNYGQFSGGRFTLDKIRCGTYTVVETNAGALLKEYTLVVAESTQGILVQVKDGAVTARLTNVYEKNTPEDDHPEDERIDIPVIKTWVDNDNRDGNRPATVTVRLLANGVETDSTVLTAGNGWSHVFEGLPTVDDQKEPIVYTFTEDPVPMYETVVNGSSIINVYQPELTSASVKKICNDNNNAAGLRPTSIYAILSDGARTVTTVVLTEANGWSATVNGLPTVINGAQVQYSWKEQEVLGYQREDTQTAGDVTTFTNKLYERPTPPPDQKGPKTPGTPILIIEEYGTPLGVEIIINHVGDCFD